jgi:hypothetical protein
VLVPPKRTLRRRQLRRTPLQRKPAGEAPLLQPLPPPKGRPGRSEAGGRRTRPHHPRGHGLSTLRQASSRA